MFDEQGNLVGMLTRPLRQRGGAAEVQVLLPEIMKVTLSNFLFQCSKAVEEINILNVILFLFHFSVSSALFFPPLRNSN